MIDFSEGITHPENIIIDKGESKTGAGWTKVTIYRGQYYNRLDEL